MRTVLIAAVLFSVSIVTWVAVTNINSKSPVAEKQSRFSFVSHEYVNGESFRVYVDNNTKIEYLQTPAGIVMLAEKL